MSWLFFILGRKPYFYALKLLPLTAKPSVS